MNLKKYITNLSSLQAFQLMRFGTLFFVSIIFPKSGISIEEIGGYELFLFIVAALCSFWINGIIQSLLPLAEYNDCFTSNQKKTPVYFNAFLLLSLLSVLVVLVLVVFRDYAAQVFTSNQQIPYFSELLLFIFFSSPAFLIEYIYLLEKKPSHILVYGALSFSLQLFAMALPLLFGYGIRESIWGLLVITGLRYIWLLGIIIRYSTIKISTCFITEHLKHGYPLIISALLGSSAVYVDGVLVVAHFDESTFAIFRYGARELPIVMLMANSFSNALIPEFSTPSKLPSSLEMLKAKSKRLMHLLFPLTILFLVTSKWLYPNIFRPEFINSAPIFNIYLLLVITRMVFPHTLLIGLKRTGVIMYASLVELLVNVVLSYAFIRCWGILGVAFATVIAYGVQKIVWILYNFYSLNIKPQQYVPVWLFTFYSVLTLIIFYFVW